MLSLKDDEISLKQNNNNYFNRLEKQSLSPSDEQDKEIKKKLKWYDNLVLQADDSSRTTTTTTTYSTLCTSLWSGLLIIVLLHIILVVFILILIL